MNFSTLVRAVLVYMKDHYPTTPEEYNFQAELKVASHWYWLPESHETANHEKSDWSLTKLPELASGPYKDIRVKTAAMETCKRWIDDLEKLNVQPPSQMNGQRIEEDGKSSPEEDENDERIYGVYLLTPVKQQTSLC